MKSTFSSFGTAFRPARPSRRSPPRAAAFQADLGFSDHNRQWLVTAYALAFGSLLLLGGHLVNLWGRKFSFILALAGFAATSAVGGAATSFAVLVAARAGQGVFAALLAPAALSILGYSFTDPAMRGKAFGLFGAVAGAGGAIGLILGGSLTQFISWRWCMYVNVPLALVTIIGAVTQIPKMERDTETRIDWVGVVLSVLGVVSLVYGFSLVEVGGWTDPQALAYMIGGLVVLAIFAFTQRIIKNPLLPLSILKDRTCSGANITVAIISAGMFSMFLFLLSHMGMDSHYGLSIVPGMILSGAGPVIRH